MLPPVATISCHGRHLHDAHHHALSSSSLPRATTSCQRRRTATSVLLAPPATTSDGGHRTASAASDLRALIPIIGAASRSAASSTTQPLYLFVSVSHNTRNTHAHTQPRKNTTSFAKRLSPWSHELLHCVLPSRPLFKALLTSMHGYSLTESLRQH